MKNIRDNLDLSGKKVFLRADLNVPIVGNKVIDDTRIIRLIPTINFLRSKGAIIILASHFARPEGKFIPEMSLKNIVPALEKHISCKIKSIDDCIGNKVENEINRSAAEDILLLENLRFYNEEENNDIKFAEKLASLADLYVNDAFSCSHRAHASITGITRFLPSYAGLLMEEEISNLNLVLNSKAAPSVAIVGGKKVSTKFKILSFLADKVDYLIIAGAMANTFIKAQGGEVGKSYFEEDFINEARDFFNKTYKAKIFIPDDYVVKDAVSSEIEVLDTDQLKPSSQIFDIGTTSVIDICNILSSSKVVLWNGPLGLFEDEKFSTSTFFIARFIAKLTKANKLKSIVGGGDVVAAVEKSGTASSMSYISTAGGAFLEYLESGSLPGIDALKVPYQ
ncbi:Phosphoglycerate kinase [Candidatus Jidaibacter acanthamoeba]|uniref:Phosphoglycerate kinase n=1 Tax=Candidatus Jidaibacter acanthamoebae TaxID=86105 RepID=A0A0C1QK33_9RICK|nr:phosphoglycerate kinase [Candidatus Jidaibacter acanthamoeba]KIE05909.1 Phosphoglycerate kinase [Candidatus Jidaibacter acanthamoeba]